MEFKDDQTCSDSVGIQLVSVVSIQVTSSEWVRAVGGSQGREDPIDARLEDPFTGRMPLGSPRALLRSTTTNDTAIHRGLYRFLTILALLLKYIMHAIFSPQDCGLR